MEKQRREPFLPSGSHKILMMTYEERKLCQPRFSSLDEIRLLLPSCGSFMKRLPMGKAERAIRCFCLPEPGYKVPQIARIVLRSEDTVARVFHRFLTGG